MKGVTESEGESDDDVSEMESSEDEQATSCQSMRQQTKVFAMRCGEDLPTATTNMFAALADPVDEEVAKDLSTGLTTSTSASQVGRRRSSIECDLTMEAWIPSSTVKRSSTGF